MKTGENALAKSNKDTTNCQMIHSVILISVIKD